MKKLLLLFFFTFFLSHSQVKYESGYITDHNGNKTSVFIQNLEWKGVPNSINYKINESDEVKVATTRDIKEFEVGNFHYVTATVNVDQSSYITRNLSLTKNPEFIEETLFLRYLVNGPANLFILDGNNPKYFFNKEGSSIEPLIFKKYNVEGRILSNNQFRQQLFSNLQCSGMDMKNIQNLEYNKNSLIDYFVDFNTCMDNDYVYERKQSEGEINLNIKAGVGFASLAVERGLDADGTKFNELEYRAGMELEYILPFNRNKWAVYFEPVYRTFSGEGKATGSIKADLSVQYSSVELGAGLRHYFFINETSKVFVNLVYVYDIPVNSEVLFANTNRAMDPHLTDLKYSNSINLGVGYNYKNRYFIEAKYLTRPFNGIKEVPTHYNLVWETKYSSLVLSIGYRLL